MARGLAQSWEGRVSRRLRKKIEMLFAHLKRILKLDRLRLRGPNGARDEFLSSHRPEPQEASEADTGTEPKAGMKHGPSQQSTDGRVSPRSTSIYWPTSSTELAKTRHRHYVRVTDCFIPEISASQLPADRVSDKRSGNKYKFRAQLADISALQPKPPRKDTKSRSIGRA